jgi:hypothetical protein
MFEMFRPWLDPAHHNPARPGELRWYITDAAGNDKEVDGPGKYEIGEGSEGVPDMVEAQSRTFIPASLDDNPHLKDTNYRAQLDALPPVLRAAMRDGSFTAGRVDDLQQVIPTQWVIDAQNRWTEKPPMTAPMSAIGVDVARGGSDQTVLSPRYDYWFDHLTVIDGVETPYGTDVAAAVIKVRRNDATIVIDLGGGYGGAPLEHLKQNLEGSPDGPDKVVFGYNGAGASTTRTRDRMFGFVNKRAESWWAFREALDPDQQGGSPIALPPDHKLVADLVSPRFKITPRGVQIEAKDEIFKRLGRSTDRGDAVVMAWSRGPTHLTHGKLWRSFEKNHGHAPKVFGSYSSRKNMKRRK